MLRLQNLLKILKALSPKLLATTIIINQIVILQIHSTRLYIISDRPQNEGQRAQSRLQSR